MPPTLVRTLVLTQDRGVRELLLQFWADAPPEDERFYAREASFEGVAEAVEGFYGRNSILIQVLCEPIASQPLPHKIARLNETEDHGNQDSQRDTYASKHDISSG